MAPHGKKLTAAFVRTVQQPGIFCDEHGLILRVKPSGYKQWIQRLFIHGKRRELGLGPVRLVTLSQAREAAAKVISMHRPNWKSAKHASQWTGTLRDYVYPKIGQKRVDWISSADVMAVLLPI